MTTFAADISAFVAKAKAHADALVRQSVQEMAFRIVESSPVDTGYFRASWWASINAEGDNPDQPVKGVASFGSPAEAMAEVIMSGKAGDTFYLLNNAAYAMPLEYGHSQQAPAGIVRPVVAAAPHIVETVAARLATGGAPPEPTP